MTDRAIEGIKAPAARPVSPAWRRAWTLPVFGDVSVLLSALLLAACGSGEPPELATYQAQVRLALESVGLDETALVLPKLNHPVSLPGRLPLVDRVLAEPLSMVELGAEFLRVSGNGATPDILAGVLQHMLIPVTLPDAPAQSADTDAMELWLRLSQSGDNSARERPIPSGWAEATGAAPVLRRILAAQHTAQLSAQAAGFGLQVQEWEQASTAVRGLLAANSTQLVQDHQLVPETLQQIGSRMNATAAASALLQLLRSVQAEVPLLAQLDGGESPLSWETPLGRVVLAGRGDDRHQGEIALLIDLGGDDAYVDVGGALAPGAVSVVIDFGGADTVKWDQRPGPGAGILGLALWLDMAGNDRYQGGNFGLGLGMLGAGMLWDGAGDDEYAGGAWVQGAGAYGVGMLVDAAGNDSYKAELRGQGFGASGGAGLLIESGGDDKYDCGGVVPDQAPDRAQRHASPRYLSMCQGYAIGMRPDTSGGIGLLLDQAGDDSYRADLFAQGGGYWFALGMLLDSSGHDRYEAFEHAQGAALHLGAGFLGDWAGDDRYSAYEHAQGVGIDRGPGVLYEQAGNDSYQIVREGQGAGIKPYGVGILIENAGDDRYSAADAAQGYTSLPDEFPETEWPVGIVLDRGGADSYDLPALAAPDEKGRIQTRQGVALDLNPPVTSP